MIVPTRPCRLSVGGGGGGEGTPFICMSQVISSQFSRKAPLGAPGSWNPRERQTQGKDTHSGTHTHTHTHQPRARGARFCSCVRKPISPGFQPLFFPGAEAIAGFFRRCFPHLASAKVLGGSPHMPPLPSTTAVVSSLWWLLGNQP